MKLFSLLNLLLLSLAIMPLSSEIIENEGSEYIKNVLEKYSNMSVYKDKTEVIMILSAHGTENQISYKSELAFKRPNKIMIKSSSELYGQTMISDGTDIYTFIPYMNKYTKISLSNKSLDSILKTDLTDFESMGTDQFLIYLFINNDKFFSEIDTEISISGEEIINNTLYDIIEIKNNDILIVVWIEKKTSLIRKIVFDASSIIRDQQLEMGIEPQELQMKYVELHNEIISNDIDDSIFHFTPPLDSEKVDSFHETYEKSDDFVFIGKKIADFEIKPINKRKLFRLSRTKASAVLTAFVNPDNNEFHELIKSLNKLYIKYNKRKIFFVAISTEDNEKKLKDYLRSNKLQIPVGIDTDNKLSNQFGVSSYPTIYITDSSGIIQQIYTGYFKGISSSIDNDIKIIIQQEKELKVDNDKKIKGLFRLWHLPLTITGLSANSLITAVDTSGDFYFVSGQGTIKKIIKQKEQIRIIKSIDLNNDGKTDYLGYKNLGRHLIALDPKCRKIWKIRIDPGINDIAIADLENDGKPEIAVGLTGIEGIKVFNNDGHLIFSSTDVVNVLGLSIGDLYNDKNPEIAALSSDGQIYIFDKEGNLIDQINPEFETNYVHIVEFNDNTSGIILAGNSGNNEILKLLSKDKIPKWEVILGNISSARVNQIRFHKESGSIAVTTKNGQIFVFNKNGNRIGYIKENGLNIQIDWFQTESGHTNLITGSIEGGLNSYYISDLVDPDFNNED